MYTVIFISGKDMIATSLAGAILDAIFELALKMLFYKNRRPVKNRSGYLFTAYEVLFSI